MHSFPFDKTDVGYAVARRSIFLSDYQGVWCEPIVGGGQVVAAVALMYLRKRAYQGAGGHVMSGHDNVEFARHCPFNRLPGI